MFTTSHTAQLPPKNNSPTKTGKTSYKHIPHREKPPHLVAKRNARERRRVQAVNSAFARLRKSVPIENRNKRLSKVKTLQKAIEYIEELKSVLGSGFFGADDPTQGRIQLAQGSGLDSSSSSSYTSNSLQNSEYEFATPSNNSSSLNTTAASTSFSSIEEISPSSKLHTSAINIANNNNINGHSENLIIPALDPYNSHLSHPTAQTVLHHHIPVPHSHSHSNHHQWYSHPPSVEPIYNWTNSWLDKQQS